MTVSNTTTHDVAIFTRKQSEEQRTVGRSLVNTTHVNILHESGETNAFVHSCSHQEACWTQSVYTAGIPTRRRRTKWYCSPHWGVKCPKTPDFGGVNRHFKPNAQNRNLYIVETTASRPWQPNSAQWIHFVGGPNMRITKSRRRMAAIVK